MPDALTVRKWRNRLALPAILAAIWLLLYTSLGLLNAKLAAGEYPLSYLVSSAHLSQPLGWLFVFSILLVLIALLLRAYATWRHY